MRIPEQTFEWQNLGECQIQQVIAAHSILPTSKQISNSKKEELLRRCFELAKPKIIFGDTYCRIHQDSIDVVKIIMREYYI